MKHKAFFRSLISCFLLLTLVTGLFTPVASAVGDISLPTADCEEVVFDYGKTVSVPIETIQNHITLINSITVSGFVGVTLTGSNSQILTAAPSGVYCTNTSTDKSITTEHGTLVRTSTELQYTPTVFQDQIIRFYAVFSLSGSSSATHILVEVRFIPASMMYYEAEDFATEISTYDTTNGGATNTAWRTVTDGTGSGNTTQSTDYVGDTSFTVPYDKKHIAGGAFFSDFDGQGNANRYSLDPVYESLQTGTLGNFDNANYWLGNGPSDSINTTSGLYTMELQTTNSYHYIQPTTNGGNLNSSSISLRPSMDDIFEIRFRMTGIERPSNPNFILCISDTLGGGVKTDSANYKAISLKSNIDQLYNGDFITVSATLKDFAYYCNSTMVYTFRADISGVTAKSGGTLQVDYVYLGPQKGALLPVTKAETGVYFGFESAITHTDPKSTKCVKSADYSSASNWCTGDDSTLTIADGVLTLKDKTTSGNDWTYNCFQPGTSLSNNDTINYVCTGDELFVIKFKTSTIGSVISGNNDKARIRLEYRKEGSSTIYDDETTCYIDFTPTTTAKEYSAHLKLTAGTVLTTLRPTFYFTQKCTFVIDYFYLVPNTTYTDKNGDDRYFIDFDRTMNERVYTTRAAYGHQRLTYYSSGGIWTHHEGVAANPSIGSGCLTLKDGNTSSLYGNYKDRIYARLANLNLDPDASHYCQVRLRIDRVNSAQPVTKGTGNPFFFLSYYLNDDGDGYSSNTYPISLTDQVEKGWFTISFKIGSQGKYKEGANASPQNLVIDIAPVVSGLQGAQVKIDYIYLGVPVVNYPEDTANPSADHLYFGFRNNLKTETYYTKYFTYKEVDYTYHTNDVYGGYDFDLAGSGGNWGTLTDTNASTTDYTVSNGNLGLLTVNVSANKPSSNIHGPFIGTTNKNGSCSFENASLNALRYHPQANSIVQIRFRLNGCTIQSGKMPKLVFLFTGYNTDTVASKCFVNYANYTYNDRYFVATEDFQTITIPLNSDFCNLALVTNIGFRFQYIQSGKVDIDYIYVGPASNSDPTYGNDSTYANDTKLSNAESLLAEGKGVRLDPSQEALDNGTYTKPAAYTESIFSFTGTGFDIISRTGPDQGTIRVSVYNATSPNDLTTDNLVKSLSVNNKGVMQLYQIPVVSIQGLPHGTYYVKIGVNKEIISDYPVLNRGKEFYFDALRIYDPIDVSSTALRGDQLIAFAAYNDHCESYPYIKEIREQLLSVSDFSKLTFDSSTAGAIFVDSEGATGLTVSDYNEIGPKNEVYLAPGQAVAFKLTLDSNYPPISVDIGAKSIEGDTTALTAGIVTSVDLSATGLAALSSVNKTISTSTPMFYSLNTRGMNYKSTNYLVIYNSYSGDNTTRHILSITDLRLCFRIKPSALIPKDDDFTPGNPEILSNAVDFTDKPTVKILETTDEVYEPYTLTVDSLTTTAVEVFLESLVETPVDPDPIALEGLKLAHSLDLASDISLNYVIASSALAEYDSFHLEVTVPTYNGNQFREFTTMSLSPVEKGGCYYFTLSNLTAVHMMDEMEANLYLTKGNQEYYTPTDRYSIATYAFSQLEKAEASESLKTLCADLLIYGSKAQIYKSYRSNYLAEEEMTVPQLSYATDLESVTFNSHNEVLTNLESPTVLWKGKTLVLDSRVGIRYVIDVANYQGDLTHLSLRLTYTDQSGTAQTAILTEPELYSEGTSLYAFDYYGLLASELRTVIDATVYAGDTPLSRTLRYSADSYGNNKTEPLLSLCRALMAYSDSAKSFFSAK
ncbi:MAG: hypothetical protein IKT58_04155 [Oscillospiraceae bacterium]|nr:hypothetical protein [Oscillospiraceae bacterium]